MQRGEEGLGEGQKGKGEGGNADMGKGG